jgi:CRISPR-associated protein Cas2
VVTLVSYDVPDDRLRLRVARTCMDFGLLRIQFSVFVGFMPLACRRELELRLRRVLLDRPGNVRIFPLCERDLALAREISAGGYRPWH